MAFRPAPGPRLPRPVSVSIRFGLGCDREPRKSPASGLTCTSQWTYHTQKREQGIMARRAAREGRNPNTDRTAEGQRIGGSDEPVIGGSKNPGTGNREQGTGNREQKM